MRALVVIPTYNEAENIAEAIGRVTDAVPATDVLVVDDASPDGTGQLADALARADQRVHVLHRPTKSGLGDSYRAGFAWGLGRGYDALVEMDADLSHPAERLPALLAALDHADVAIGSRYVPGGSTADWPWYRRVISSAGNAYVSLVLGLGVHDATAGFRAYRSAVLRAIDPASVRSNGYCFQIEMTDRARAKGFSVAEIPIRFVERVAGESKMRLRIVVEAMWRVTLWGVRDRVGGRRRRPQRRLVDPDATVISERALVEV